MRKKAVLVIDIFIVMVCFCGFAASVYMFQNDFFSTLRSIPVKPAGFAMETAAAVTAVNAELEAPSLNIPEADSIVFIGKGRPDFYFSWAGSMFAHLYTVNISHENDMDKPVLKKTTRNNYFVYGQNETALVPGLYFWNVSYTGADGQASPVSHTGTFIAAEKDYSQRLVFPPDRYSIEETYLPDLRFSWETNVSNEVRFQVSSKQDFSRAEIDAVVTDDYYQGISLPPGEWYWRIIAEPDDKSIVIPTPARRFTMFLPFTREMLGI
jgi:hypothetical protein